MGQQQNNGGGRQLAPLGSAALAFESARLPITPQFAEKLGVTVSQWIVLCDQLFPSATSAVSVAMALSYCKVRGLDIYKKPVNIVSMWNTKLRKNVETVWPSIAEIRITAHRTKDYAGMDAIEFGPEVEGVFEGEQDEWENGQKVGTKIFRKTVTYPAWASVVVYRFVHGQRVAFHTKIFWKETYAKIGKTKVPNDMWENRPYGQFDKCLEAAALRRAFPEELGNTYAAEEMEGRTIDHDDPLGVLSTPAVAKGPPPAPAAPAQPAKSENTSGEPATGQGGELLGKTVEDADVDEYDDDPEAVFKDANEKLGLAKSVEDIEEIWSGFEHHAERMFPPDWDHLASIKKRHEGRVERLPDDMTRGP